MRRIKIKIYVRIKFYKIEFFFIFFYSTYLYPIFFFDHCYNIFYTDQQEMNKLNNQKCSLRSVLLSLSILLTLLFIAICTAAFIAPVKYFNSGDDLLVFKTDRNLDPLPVRLDSRSFSEGITHENGGEHDAPTGAPASVASSPGATSATRTPAALDLDLNEASDLHSSTTIPVVVAVSEMSKINHVPVRVDIFEGARASPTVSIGTGAINSERLGSRNGASAGEGLAFINIEMNKNMSIAQRTKLTMKNDSMQSNEKDLNFVDSCSYAETGAVDKNKSTQAVAGEKVSYIACLLF